MSANYARVIYLTEGGRGRLSEPAYDLLLPPMMNHLLSLQRGDAFVASEQWRQRRSTRNSAEEHPYAVGPDGLLRFDGRVYVLADLTVRRKLMTLFHNGPIVGYLSIIKIYKRITRYYY